jgi:SAM-dependent methyltransferase
MDRADWLRERRAAVQAEYDDDAPHYDDDPYPTATHSTFIGRLLETCPPNGIVLDAPCGTGPYFAQVRGAGRRVVGIDQSAGMLEQARSKGLADRLENIGLQEMTFASGFDGSMTIDAMEHVSPEDWPVVLGNLHRAVRPGGYLYLTVEEVPEGDIDAGFVEGQSKGLPLVRGEVIEGDTAGYHFYPGRARVADWLSAEGLEMVEDASDWNDGWGYWHLLLRTQAGTP